MCGSSRRRTRTCEKRLKKEISAKTFSIVSALSSIKVPPLREHSEDIPLLVDHFIDMICEEYDMPRKPMDKKAVEMLRQMPWTGNIRELRNVIERLVVPSGTKITPNDVELYC